MGWKLVGEGTSIDDLHPVVADRELKHGTRVRFKLDVMWPAGKAFDLAGAERLFSISGVEILDVRSDGWSGAVIEGKATGASPGPWIIAIIAFVKAHWVALAIGGFALYVIVSNIKFFAETIALAASLIPILIIVGVVVIGIILLRKGVGAVKGG